MKEQTIKNEHSINTLDNEHQFSIQASGKAFRVLSSLDDLIGKDTRNELFELGNAENRYDYVLCNIVNRCYPLLFAMVDTNGFSLITRDNEACKEQLREICQFPVGLTDEEKKIIKEIKEIDNG